MSMFTKYGMFDENLTTNQDDEYNLRLIAAGERLYFDPAIRCRYFARASAASLLKQYWRYGRFKFEVFIRNRRIGGLRQLAPAAWVAILCGAVVLGKSAIGLCLWLVISLYLAAGALATCMCCLRLGAIGIAYLPLAVGVHAAYGAGSWYGFFQSVFRRFVIALGTAAGRVSPSAAQPATGQPVLTAPDQIRLEEHNRV
jgi:succinoglycan biosynthesis protein ExoA